MICRKLLGFFDHSDQCTHYTLTDSLLECKIQKLDAPTNFFQLYLWKMLITLDRTRIYNIQWINNVKIKITKTPVLLYLSEKKPLIKRKKNFDFQFCYILHCSVYFEVKWILKNRMEYSAFWKLMWWVDQVVMATHANYISWSPRHKTATRLLMNICRSVWIDATVVVVLHINRALSVFREWHHRSVKHLVPQQNRKYPCLFVDTTSDQSLRSEKCQSFLLK